jgi:putative copper export protein/methionine-rich copper-binding protein CopC
MRHGGATIHPTRVAGAPTGALRLLVLALCLLAALPAAGAAHTRLESSAPAADEVLRTPPAELRLRFTQGVEPRLTSAILVSAAGDTVRAGAAVPEPGTGNRALTLALPGELGPGQYMVEWRTAGADGHVIRGAFSFAVEGLALPADTAAQPVPAPPPPSPDAPAAGGEAEAQGVFASSSPLAVLVRWLGFLGLLGLVGSVAFRLGVVPGAERRGLPAEAGAVARRRVRGAAVAALALFALGLAGRLWLQAGALAGPEGSGAGEAMGLVLESTAWGSAWKAQAAAGVVFLVGLLLFRGAESAAGWRVAAVATAFLAGATAYSGHAAATERLRSVALLADTVHVLGAGAWMGALALLLAIGIPVAVGTGPGGRGAALAAMVRAFSPLALAGAATAAATGVVSALFHLGAPAELWGTAYGRALLVKLVLVGLVAAAGWYNWRRVTPALGSEDAGPRLRASVAGEVGLGVLVVLATALLVGLPTP